jgi:hypothetical protein
MATYYATCHSPDNSDLDRRIQGLGGSGWWWNIDTIILMIDQGHLFYTSPPTGYGKKIVTRTHANGLRYLTTDGDGFPPNNILNLPRCG